MQGLPLPLESAKIPFLYPFHSKYQLAAVLFDYSLVKKKVLLENAHSLSLKCCVNEMEMNLYITCVQLSFGDS